MARIVKLIEQREKLQRKSEQEPGESRYLLYCTCGTSEKPFYLVYFASYIEKNTTFVPCLEIISGTLPGTNIGFNRIKTNRQDV
jgi:hypothetical protein